MSGGWDKHTRLEIQLLSFFCTNIAPKVKGYHISRLLSALDDPPIMNTAHDVSLVTGGKYGEKKN